MGGPIVRSPTSTEIPFDNSSNGMTSTNLQDAITEVNQKTTTSGNEEHGRNIIDSDYTIKNNRQMLLFQECEIINEYTLTIEGELVILE